ncbi:MAG: glycosyltransferase [Muribaculaceae bacterium]|nr:glycosyltransferase [Muribaculaceae bacterium]
MSSTNLRILFVITSLRLGGAERLVADLAKGLKNRGHHVDIFVFDATETPITIELKRYGISIFGKRKGYRQMRNPLVYFPLRRLLKQNKYDIIHTHNTTPQFIAALVASNGAKLITTEHNTHNRRRKIPILSNLDRLMYSRYRKVVCVSEQAKTNLLAYLKLEDVDSKFPVVYNGIDLQKFKSSDLPASPRHNPLRVIMVSGFRKQKDQATLIKAFALLSDAYHLSLVGDGIERNACEQLVKELAIGHRIEFHGFKADVAPLLAESDIVVLSTHYEGMPLSIIEGMAAGRPVIASDVDGLREVVHGAGILFQEGDSAELAAKIVELANDNTLYAVVARKCALRAEKFDIVSTIDSYEKIYHAV